MKRSCIGHLACSYLYFLLPPVYMAIRLLYSFIRPGIGELLDALNSQSCRSKVLLTSRLTPQGMGSYPATFMHSYQVAGLDSAEGIELFRKQGVGINVASEAVLSLAVAQCGGHALALTLLA